ncbi:MAG: hypothetical protein Q9202_007252 [Teloschistes flavicans]
MLSSTSSKRASNAAVSDCDKGTKWMAKVSSTKIPFLLYQPGTSRLIHTPRCDTVLSQHQQECQGGLVAEEDVVGEEAGNLEQKEVLCQKIPHLKRTSLHKKKLLPTETLTQSHKKDIP